MRFQHCGKNCRKPDKWGGVKIAGQVREAVRKVGRVGRSPPPGRAFLV
ncbi:hypothetical protein AFE_1526 [Acidithiobacillus ferrooxidans ATCC 23270]|uniref:Uncharacterized protein n=1 Tax=Acidithiobacillus ferrooxidans (strain ATCC 23270 / DSM 14882 / CIP 104768 / NCIMB 8455) TaxID=243159 RepID=B7JAA4_ACIF2|nr:hypothetical protein AFE_1526 [Acidithiobacillus ferrooxidans ATCC 23270]